MLKPSFEDFEILYPSFKREPTHCLGNPYIYNSYKIKINSTK